MTRHRLHTLTEAEREHIRTELQHNGWQRWQRLWLLEAVL